MITEIHIKNCKSIVDAAVKLSPFTLLIGANGSGKTTFLQTIKECTSSKILTEEKLSTTLFPIARHINYPLKDTIRKMEETEKEKEYEQEILFRKDFAEFKLKSIKKSCSTEGNIFPELTNIKIYSIDPSIVGEEEKIIPNPIVEETGRGIVQVLDAMKTGDREDLFEKIETNLCQYIPEIEKLSFITKDDGKRLQVREKYLKKPLPLSLMSEGTKFILAILTIIYQEHPPTLIGIEDIDRGLHPRLFEKIIRVCRDVTQQDNMPQIIATTHNPYIVDQFKGNEDAVIIVEKKNGETTFTPLSERIAHLEVEADDPLGELWFSGFVGGVPSKGV